MKSTGETFVERARELWAIVGEVWNTPVWGLPEGTLTVGQLSAAGLILAVAFVFRGLLARLLIWIAHKLTSRTATKLDDKIIDAVLGPVKLVPIIIGVFAAMELVGLAGDARELADRVLRSLIAITIFWTLFAAVEPMQYAMGPLRRRLTTEMFSWITKALKMFFAFVGAAAVLEIWGVPVGPILTGLGIFGVAVALGAQDLFKNLIAGLTILLERRFERGDWILVEGVVEGTVVQVNFRSTTVRRFDKSPVYVPNSELADNPLTNFTRMTHRRIYWKIGLEYSTTNDQLRYVRDKLYAFVTADEAFASPDDVPTFVFIDSFAASSIDVMLYCFTVTTKWEQWLTVKERLAYRIKEIVEEAGAGFAFPSQTNYLVDMAQFEPPPTPDLVRAHADAITKKQS